MRQSLFGQAREHAGDRTPQLCHHPAPVRYQDNLATGDLSEVGAQPVLQLLDRNRLHAGSVAPRSYLVKMFQPRVRRSPRFGNCGREQDRQEVMRHAKNLGLGSLLTFESPRAFVI